MHVCVGNASLGRCAAYHQSAAINHFRLSLPIVLFIFPNVLKLRSRNWHELPCSKCGAPNFIVVDMAMIVECPCISCGETVTFVGILGACGCFLDRLKDYGKFDSGKPF